MSKNKKLTDKQKERQALNRVLDFNEEQMMAMQKQEWNNLDERQVNILENFIAVAIATMRICPPSYVAVASNTVKVRANTNHILSKLEQSPGVAKPSAVAVQEAIEAGDVVPIRPDVVAEKESGFAEENE